MITVACVFWGDKFSDDYVYNLKSMVERNTTVPHQFVCFSDRELEGIKTVKLIPGYEGWWNKMQMFNTDFKLGNRVVYLDLDTLIVDNIDWLLEYDGMFMGIEDLGAVNEHQPELKGRLQSGVMSWDYRLNSHLWNRFTSSGESQRYRGDGEYLNHIVPKYQRDFIQKRYKGKLKSYKYQVYSEGITDDLSIICFHGRPSIPQAMTETVTTGWKNSGKTYEPQDWIKDYWR
ncbi:hypothetical protein OAA38_00640 [bacterium]|nr:hypothetical protein [bacterium]|tara:strand:+ start:746 stop:1438 length:693 start_codon:yes stop_codon:yes gene_type:complete